MAAISRAMVAMDMLRTSGSWQAVAVAVAAQVAAIEDDATSSEDASSTAVTAGRLLNDDECGCDECG